MDLRRIITVLLLLLSASVFAQKGNSGGEGAGNGQAQNEQKKQRVMIEFTTGRGRSMENMFRGLGGEVHHKFDRLYKSRSGEERGVIAVTLPESALEGIKHNPHIKRIELDPKRYLLSQTVPYGIDQVQARDIWDVNRDGQVDAGAPTGDGITVGIIDSGLYVGHEEFAGMNIIGGYPSGWDTDGCGHGTHVAGTIGAINNATGVVGVSPGDVSLYIVKVFANDCNWSYASDLIDAIQRCIDNGAQVVSMSLGGGDYSASEEQAMQNMFDQGTLIIAAAGNDGNTQMSYPASYTPVMSVAATDSSNNLASFSQRNAQVEIAAPGVQVLSTLPFGAVNRLSTGGNAYDGNQIQGASYGSVTAEIVDGGTCEAVSDWSGKIVLCQRGNNTFEDKVDNVESGNGVGVAIYNNVPGNFMGSLGDFSYSIIPAISLSQEDGQVLMANSLGQTGTLESTAEQAGSGYAAWDGTSMATPHVSGAAAVIWSANPAWTSAQIREAINTTALDLGTAGRDDSFGHGLIQMKDALDHLGGGVLRASFSHVENGLTVSFDGSSSSDPNGTIISYAWDFGDGNNGTGQTTSHTFAQEIPYNVTLTVTNDNNETASVTLVVDLSPYNDPPNAVFTHSGNGLTMNFDGSGSNDPNGTISSWSWNFGDGTSGTGTTVSHTYASAGSYTVTLTVTDNGGETDTQSETLTVHEPINELSNGVPVTGLSAGFDESISFFISVPSGATDLSIVSTGGTGDVDLYVNYGAPATLADWDFRPWRFGNEETIDVSNPSAGNWYIMAYGYDNYTGVTLTATYTVPGNEDPTASFTHNATNLSVAFDASASNDPDGSIASYDWDFGDGSAGTGMTTSHTYAAAGSYTVTLTITDNEGAQDTSSATVTVNDNPPGNLPPTASFTSSNTDLDASFDASGSSDPDGTIVSYSWDFGDGSKNDTGVTATYTYAVAGTYTVTLTVTDNDGAQATSTSTITVTDPGSGNGGLDNGVPLTDLAGGGGEQLNYYITVPEGASNLLITTSGGTGDADLYVKFGQEATLTNWDYRPFNVGNNETVSVDNPSAGDWHIMINGYGTYTGLTLVATWTTDSNPPVVDTFTGTLAPSANVDHEFTVSQGGMINITLNWDNASDLDLSLFDPGGIEVAFSASVSNPETLTHNTNGVNGVWTVEVRNYTSSGTAANYILDVSHK